MPVFKRYAKNQMKLVPDSRDAFLVFDEIVSINDSIRSKVESIIAPVDGIERAKSIFEWVRDEIPHSKDLGVELVTCSAIEAFSSKTGICFPKSHLVASMMRHAGIPCGFCYQVFENPLASEEESRALHGLNAIYLESTDSWHRIDPRGNREDIQGEFSTTEEILAFPEMEFLDDCIYAVPLQVVVEGLQNADSIAHLWPKLPSTPKA